MKVLSILSLICSGWLIIKAYQATIIIYVFSYSEDYNPFDLDFWVNLLVAAFFFLFSVIVTVRGFRKNKA